jgi:hypothetical protein
MSFAEIERVTGVKLPPKAQHQRAWWSNNPSNNVMTKVWLEAGFRSERVDMQRRKLVFRRVHAAAPSPRGAAGASKHHPLYGALRGLVRTTPGTDVTAPGDPEWGKQE